ncbi:Tripartite ATP-independent periplasmic transporter, DctQ component [Shimia sp. SK013]|uniref:TRAP transporter small permease n=1 Tax=Shimia sp. SK013 TaxID=1389006 RepID=UPI0006CD19BF|nr:TRAP transporter small permease [Shimia sp. SK013]KPA21281.1 Tripartite ATP-independent periplasmic transporter, DctQ component [Shimia sp. SK013]
MQEYPGWINRGERILGWLSNLCIFAASCALVVLVTTFGWLVFGRYVLNATPTWVEQLALLLVCYIAYLGAAAGVHEQTHLGVTLFRDAMGPKVSAALRLFNDVVLSVFGALMMVASLELFQFGWSTMLPMLNIPESFRTLSALLCGGLVCIFAGFRALFRLALMMRGQSYIDGEVV